MVFAQNALDIEFMLKRLNEHNHNERVITTMFNTEYVQT